ncbi:MAG TPA: hypothetical protein VFB14_18570 [Bryobacteraceae bacterium]|jgi:probable HAF family extracellular repeat protein|nr:hypothetical protein [Bryobacteraceae bacterium]
MKLLTTFLLLAVSSYLRADTFPVTFIWQGGLIATTPYATSDGAVFLPATINSINDSGYIAGATVNGPQLLRSAGAWNGNAFTTLGALSGYNESFANGLNNAGALVGVSLGRGGIPAQEPTEWIGGRIVDLGLAPGFMQGSADAVNEAGQVVGLQITSSGEQSATLWANGRVTALTAPSHYSEAIAINNLGVIVGGVDGQPAVWQNGALSLLPCSGGGNVYGINDSGQAVGICGGHAYMWYTTTGAATDLGPGVAQSINNAGVVVGRAGADLSNPLTNQTFVWSASGGMQILSGFAWSEPFGINDADSIVGYGEVAPEPATLFLSFAGLGMIVASLLRGRARKGAGVFGRCLIPAARPPWEV